jgi:SNF2 family DNA or RNA helicase
MTPRFSEGQNVQYLGTGKIGTVNKVIKGTRSFQYKITIDGKTRVVAERFLEPVVDVEESIIEDFAAGELGTHEDYRLFQTWLRLSKPIESNLYSYLGSKTLFNRYQFKPLLRFLSSNSEERLFIADEVGVGKTIEAGIIMKELMARGRLDYRSPVLIVCPFSLGPKWIKEMKERFGFYFHLHDGDSLRHMLKTLVKEGIFPQGYLFSIVGLQLLRREEYLSILRELDSKRSEPTFELVIIDEAHHMRNQETDSNELGNILSSMTEAMLMLSATPLNLRNEDLFNQMHILNPSAFPDVDTFEALQSPVIKLNRISQLTADNQSDSFEAIRFVLERLKNDPLGLPIISHSGVQDFFKRIQESSPLSTEEIARYQRLFVSLSPLYYSFTRTRKREALEHQVYREAHELPVALSPSELSFQDEVLEVIQKHYLSQEMDKSALGLVMNIHRRMVSSCIPAIVQYLRWSIAEGRILNDNGQLDEPEDDSQIGTVALDLSLREKFTRLVEKAKRIETSDSKYLQFKQMLQKIMANPETPQVMVFSFFIRTLEYLRRRLRDDGFAVEVIHGGVPLQSRNGIYGRDQIMLDFEKGRFQILLSSEVGGEGLDFQYCHAIINYDLPYNPMRVEQRIGRIDRFGQKADKVIVANLFIEGTVDEEIYDRLYRRIRLVEDGVGSLEPILGKELADLQTAIIAGAFTEEQKEEMQRRMEEHIASAKIEMEEFEKSRRELLSDDYMVRPLNNLSKGDFVSPEDASQLTELCLSKWKGCNFTKDKAGLPEITLSTDTVSDLEHFLRTPSREGGYNELHELVSHKGSIKVIFDGSIAAGMPDRTFLSPTGYWSRFLIYKLEQENSLYKTFSFELPESETIPKGEYLCFFFEIRMEGIKTEIEFLGLPVEIESQTVKTVDFDRLPRLLAYSRNSSLCLDIPQLDVNQFLDVARDYLDRVLEDRRRTASDDNRYRVESRVAALKKASRMKHVKLQQQIDNHVATRNAEGKQPDDNYIRLTKARMEKESLRLQTKIDELQKRQTLTLDHNLGAVAYLRVRGN